ncbi:hypothetical protein HC928_11195 [bacterium]|nr:hypothetical protein [bacterium]
MANLRRTPDSLAEQLESVLPAGQRGVSGSSDNPLVQTAVIVSLAEFPELSDDAMRRIEFRMLGHYEGLYGKQRVQKRGRLLRYAAAVCLLLIMLIGAGLPFTAESLPGDALYPAKRLYEGLELGLAQSDEARAEVYLRQARRRADEAAELVALGKFETSVVERALVDLANAAAVYAASDQVSEAQRMAATADVLRMTVLDAQTRGLISGEALADYTSRIDIILTTPLLPPDDFVLPLPSLTPTFTSVPPSPTPTQTRISPSATPLPPATMSRVPESEAPELSPLVTISPLPSEAPPVPTLPPTRVPREDLFPTLTARPAFTPVSPRATLRGPGVMTPRLSPTVDNLPTRPARTPLPTQAVLPSTRPAEQFVPPTLEGEREPRPREGVEGFNPPPEHWPPAIPTPELPQRPGRP